jgi:hypothetical protein
MMMYDDIYVLTFIELIEHPTQGLVKGYRFNSRSTRKDYKKWMKEIGIAQVLRDLDIGWDETVLLPMRSSIVFPASPENFEIVKKAVNQLPEGTTILRSYATVQKQIERESAERYEIAQRARYATMMIECAQIRATYPDLAE